MLCVCRATGYLAQHRLNNDKQVKKSGGDSMRYSLHHHQLLFIGRKTLNAKGMDLYKKNSYMFQNIRVRYNIIFDSMLLLGAFVDGCFGVQTFVIFNSSMIMNIIVV